MPSAAVPSQSQRKRQEIQGKGDPKPVGQPVPQPPPAVKQSAKEHAAKLRARRGEPKAPVDYREILTPTVQYEIYNPGNEPAQSDCDGETYVVPPIHGFHEFREVLSGRTLGFYHRPGVLPLKDGPGGLPARTILTFLMGEDGRTGPLALQGCRALFGDDPEKDEEVISEAEQAWVEKKRGDWNRVVQAHETRVMRAREAKIDPPRPTRAVREAYEGLAEFDAVSNLRFECGICAWGFPEQADLDVHLVTHHKQAPLADEARERLGVVGSDDVIEGGLDVEPRDPNQTTHKEPTRIVDGGQVPGLDPSQTNVVRKTDHPSPDSQDDPNIT